MLESINVGQVLEGIIYAGSILGAIAVISHNYKKTVDKIVGPIVEEKLHQIEDHKYDEIQQELSNLANSITEYQSKSSDISDMLVDNALCSTRNKLLELCNKFIEAGEIDDHSLDAIEKLNASYMRLGGNSFIKDKMKKIRVLPNRPDEF